MIDSPWWQNGLVAVLVGLSLVYVVGTIARTLRASLFPSQTASPQGCGKCRECPVTAATPLVSLTPPSSKSPA